jgi:hypothetical protein
LAASEDQLAAKPSSSHRLSAAQRRITSYARPYRQRPRITFRSSTNSDLSSRVAQDPRAGRLQRPPRRCAEPTIAIASAARVSGTDASVVVRMVPALAWREKQRWRTGGHPGRRRLCICHAWNRRPAGSARSLSSRPCKRPRARNATNAFACASTAGRSESPISGRAWAGSWRVLCSARRLRAHDAYGDEVITRTAIRRAIALPRTRSRARGNHVAARGAGQQRVQTTKCLLVAPEPGRQHRLTVARPRFGVVAPAPEPLLPGNEGVHLGAMSRRGPREHYLRSIPLWPTAARTHLLRTDCLPRPC